MNVTKAELAGTVSGRGAQQLPVVEGWKDGALTVFIVGTPRNPLNSSHGHWSKHAKWAKGWREHAGNRLLPRVTASTSNGTRRTPPKYLWPWKPADGKHVTFTVYARNRFDDDNLRAVCKPVRDALKDMRVIDDDRDSSGHTFVYTQSPSRKKDAVLGIAVTIRVAP